VEVPAVKEPQGLSQDDGKRPDGLTLVPWQSGRSAMWDVMVVHTLAASYVSQSAAQAASAATAASERKSANIFCPAIFSVQWLLRRWVLWRMRLSIS